MPPVSSCFSFRSLYSLALLLCTLLPALPAAAEAPSEPVTFAPLPQKLGPADGNSKILSDSEYLKQQALRPIQVVLLVNDLNNPYWQQVRNTAQQTADSLNIRLKVIDLHNNPLRPVRVLSTLANASEKPDAVIFSNIKNTGKPVLDLLEKHRIHSVLYDNGFQAKERIGKPGELYRFWLGQIRILNYEASRLLTRKLLAQALQQYPTQRPLPMIVLEGNTSSETNARRLLGMFDALVDFRDQVELKQIFHTRYDPLHAYNAIQTARQRYPDLRIIWAANDQMAMSAVEASKTQGLKPGKDWLISGFDHTRPARDAISRQELFDSYGGHYHSAAWALLYLNDVLRGNRARYQVLDYPLHSARQQKPVQDSASHTLEQYHRLNPTLAAP